MPFPKRDVTGQRFGRLVVTGDAPRRDRTKHRCVACRCDCGADAVVRLGTLLSGRTRSCGCFQREQLAVNHANGQRSILGRTFGRLTVTAAAPSRYVNGKWHGYWKCLCACGVVSIIQRSSLTSRATTSCGCWQQEQLSIRARTHGGAGASGKRWPEYNIWNAMRQRCENPNNPAYKDYGGRGIGVCERWRSFQNFIDDVGRRPMPGLQLDRVNNNGNYEPENVRWVSREANMQNRTFVSRDEADVMRATIARYEEQYGQLTEAKK